MGHNSAAGASAVGVGVGAINTCPFSCLSVIGLWRVVKRPQAGHLFRRPVLTTCPLCTLRGDLFYLVPLSIGDCHEQFDDHRRWDEAHTSIYSGFLNYGPGSNMPINIGYRMGGAFTENEEQADLG